MILIAIGGNLPGLDGAPPLETCRRAALALDALPGLRLRGLSRWYRSAPIPPSGQDFYINGVALLAGDAADPAGLMLNLQDIETRFGRQRSAPNAARILDLDIIAIGDLVRCAPDPVLPHPRAHERGFVLLPLRDVAPSWRWPGLGLSIDTMIARLPAQDIEAL